MRWSNEASAGYSTTVTFAKQYIRGKSSNQPSLGQPPITTLAPITTITPRQAKLKRQRYLKRGQGIGLFFVHFKQLVQLGDGKHFINFWPHVGKLEFAAVRADFFVQVDQFAQRGAG